MVDAIELDAPVVGGWEAGEVEDGRASEIASQVIESAMIRAGKAINLGGTMNGGARMALMAGEAVNVMPGGSVQGDQVGLGAPRVNIEGKVITKELYIKTEHLFIGRDAVIPKPDKWYIEANVIEIESKSITWLQCDRSNQPAYRRPFFERAALAA